MVIYVIIENLENTEYIEIIYIYVYIYVYTHTHTEQYLIFSFWHKKIVVVWSHCIYYFRKRELNHESREILVPWPGVELKPLDHQGIPCIYYFMSIFYAIDKSKVKFMLKWVCQKWFQGWLHKSVNILGKKQTLNCTFSIGELYGIWILSQ